MNKQELSRRDFKTVEPMVDAREAAFALCLPYYWFSDRAMRAAKRIPHYPMGGLVRFRMSELEQWARTSSATAAQTEEK